MARLFRLPDLGEGVHEGEVLAVHVAVGQQVKEGDIIMEVETDKAAVEIPSPFTGKVSDVRVQPGDIVRFEEVLIAFENDSAPHGTESIREELAAGPAVDSQVYNTPGPTAGPAVDSQVYNTPGPTAGPAVDSQEHNAPVPASPATRRLARQLGVDLREITPSGRGGVVTAADVRGFAQVPEKTAGDGAPPDIAAAERHESRVTSGPLTDTALPDFARYGPVERVAFRSIRRTTARQMVRAWTRIPHVNSQDSADITRLEAFRRKHKADIAADAGRLTLTVFALKATATALKVFPQFNASLDETAQEIVYKKYFHIGVAVNTRQGLIVPVIRDVDRKSIKELSIELFDITQRTHSRKVTREELQGGSFTITNAGALGGSFFTPIINHPEVAILGMGQARMQPLAVARKDGSYSLEPRLMMPLVLCIDHRVLDGADAIGFLKAIIDALEDPDELLMTMI